MNAKLVAKTRPNHQEQIEGGVEAAVARLVRGGLSRREGLARLDNAFSAAIGLLTNAGLGDISRLRAQAMVCATKLDAENKAYAERVPGSGYVEPHE